MLLLLCADLLRFHRSWMPPETTPRSRGTPSGRQPARDADLHDNCDDDDGEGGDGGSIEGGRCQGRGKGKRKAGVARATIHDDSQRTHAAGGVRKKVRSIDPWEDLMRCLRSQPPQAPAGAGGGVGGGDRSVATVGGIDGIRR